MCCTDVRREACACARGVGASDHNCNYAYSGVKGMYKKPLFFFIVRFVFVLPISLERRTTNKTEWNLHYSVARHFQLFFMYIYLPCLFKRLRADLQRCSPRSRLPLQFLRHSLPQDDSVAGSCNERKKRDNKSYRVINLDWEKVLSFNPQMYLLKDLELIFLYSTMFDVFCVKISLVCVKYFVHNINLK